MKKFLVLYPLGGDRALRFLSSDRAPHSLARGWDDRGAEERRHGGRAS